MMIEAVLALALVGILVVRAVNILGKLKRHILMQDHPSSSMFPSNTHDAETWKAYWNVQGQPWRTEPVIDEERQQRLLSYSQGGC